MAHHHCGLEMVVEVENFISVENVITIDQSKDFGEELRGKHFEQKLVTTDH